MSTEDPRIAAVLALHQPVMDRWRPGEYFVGQGYTDHGYAQVSPVCGTCGTFDEYAVPWPCPTVQIFLRG